MCFVLYVENCIVYIYNRSLVISIYKYLLTYLSIEICLSINVSIFGSEGMGMGHGNWVTRLIAHVLNGEIQTLHLEITYRFWCPQDSAKLVHITPITMVYGT